MENVDTVYEVNESNSTYRFLTPRAFEEEYPMLYNAVQKWDATFLNIANVKERGAMVKSHPSENIMKEEVETLADVT